MGLGDAFQESTDTALRVMASRPFDLEPPKPKHSAWSVIPRAVAGAFAEVGGNIMDVASAYGQVSAAMGQNSLATVPTSADERKQRLEAFDKLKSDGIDWQPEESRANYRMAQDLRPDPITAGTAENIVFAVTKGLTKAIGAGMITGPVAGAGVFGASEGLQTAEDLAAQGVDLATRTKAGAVSGVMNAAGMALPVAGKTLAGTAALVAVGGPAQFMAQQAATRHILQSANYGRLAMQFDPLDPVGLAVASLLPAGFATWAKLGAKGGTKPANSGTKPAESGTATPEQIDAAMVHNLTIARDAHEAMPIEAVRGMMAPEAAKVQADVAEVLRAEVGPVSEAKYTAGEKYHAKIPEVTTIKVAQLKRMNSNEVATVPDNIAAQMDFSEPIKVSVFADGEMRIVDGHHRVAAARQRGIESLPVELQAINAKGEVLQRLISESAPSQKVGAGTTAANDLALDPWNEPQAPRTFEQRIGDENIRSELLRMKGETGWAEVGGRMIRQQDDGGNETITRTAWVPNAEWWPGRPKGLKETDLHKAIDKAVAGEKLNPAERRAVEYMADVAEQRQKSSAWKPTGDELAETGLASHNELDVAMTARAAEINPDAVESLATRFESDDAGFMRGIKELLDEHDRQAVASRQEGQRAPDATAGQPAHGASQQSAALRSDAVIPPAGTRSGDPHIASVIARAEDLKANHPDMPVAVREDGSHVTFADELAAIRKQAKEGTEAEFGADDAPLLQVAAECFLSMGSVAA